MNRLHGPRPHVRSILIQILERTGPADRQTGAQIVNIARPDLDDGLLGGALFDLEQPNERAGRAVEVLVDGRIIEVNRVDGLANQLGRVSHHV